MAEVPGLFYHLDRLDREADQTSNSSRFMALRNEASRLLRELSNWPSTILDMDPQCAPAGLPPQSQALASAFSVCYASILSLATVSDFFDLPLRLPSNLKSSGTKDWDGNVPRFQQNTHVRRLLAREICHIADATLRGDQRISAAFFFIFSLQVAHAHLDAHAPEAVRLEELLNAVIADQYGFETGRTREWASLFNSPPAISSH